MIEITSESQLLAMIEGNGPADLFLFKHSVHCPASSDAFSEFKAFAENHPDVDCGYVDLFAHRNVSDLLEKVSKVKHESPQLIQYYEGNAIWTTSHGAITQQAIESHKHQTS